MILSVLARRKRRGGGEGGHFRFYHVFPKHTERESLKRERKRAQKCSLTRDNTMEIKSVKAAAVKLKIVIKLTHVVLPNALNIFTASFSFPLFSRKIKLPATTTFAPLSTTASIVSKLTPPSTWMSSVFDRLRNRLTFSSAVGWSF